MGTAQTLRLSQRVAERSAVDAAFDEEENGVG